MQLFTWSSINDEFGFFLRTDDEKLMTDIDDIRIKFVNHFISKMLLVYIIQKRNQFC